jgi:glucan phosphoethanolaminetransferase (alkaline phosphatase superfamily)
VVGSERRRVNGWWAYWLLTALGCTVAATTIDAVLLQRKWNYLSGGFLARDYAATWSERLGFFSGSLLADFAVMSIGVTLTLWLALFARFRPRQAVALATMACLVPLAVVEFIYYRLGEFLGDAFDLRLMFELSGRNVSELLAVSTTRPTDVLWTGAAVALPSGWLVWVVARELTRHLWARTVGFVNPHALRALIASCSLIAVASSAVIVLRGASDALDNGLKRKPSVIALSYVISLFSDVDRDGYGILGRIPDTAPLDASIHPFAVDVPGNGIDEDGVGGDLPGDFPVHVEPSVPTTPWARKPDVLFVMLESVRDDMVGSVVDGRPITPVLDRLGSSGIRARAAYSHNGFTVQSRTHVFTGSLLGGVRTTLIDDFKRQGYEVAYFSGQDESFGGDDNNTGSSRADVFYDARADVKRRYSASTTQGSLAVSADVVLERVSAFLAKRRREKPLFLYVNLHDTHFPYHHNGIKPIISGPVLQQYQIRPSSSADLRRMYANTLANVDQAIGRLLDMLGSALGGKPGVIVTSDHGESLFDGGSLGHGYVLDDAQTKIPLITTLPMKILQPWGQSDLRGALVEALVDDDTGESAPRRAALEMNREREVFQYLGSVNAPAQIALTRIDRRIIYDFRRQRISAGEAQWIRPGDAPAMLQEDFLRLVRTWESLVGAPAAGRDR